MPPLYANLPTITHSLDGFTERLNNLHDQSDNDGFIKTALTGQYKDRSGVEKQIFIDPLLNRVSGTDVLKFTRDYDSAIGISNSILVQGPITLHAIPHPTFALTTSVHLHFPIARPEVRLLVLPLKKKLTLLSTAAGHGRPRRIASNPKFRTW
jgi:hypothetical protein